MKVLLAVALFAVVAVASNDGYTSSSSAPATTAPAPAYQSSGSDEQYVSSSSAPSTAGYSGVQQSTQKPAKSAGFSANPAGLAFVLLAIVLALFE